MFARCSGSPVLCREDQLLLLSLRIGDRQNNTIFPLLPAGQRLRTADFADQKHARKREGYQTKSNSSRQIQIQGLFWLISTRFYLSYSGKYESPFNIVSILLGKVLTAIPNQSRDGKKGPIGSGLRSAQDLDVSSLAGSRCCVTCCQLYRERIIVGSRVVVACDADREPHR